MSEQDSNAKPAHVNVFLEADEIRMLWWMLAAVLPLVLIVGVLFVFTAPKAALVFVAAFAVVLTVARLLLDAGRVLAASRVIVYGCWVVFAVLAAIRGGPSGIAASFLISICVLAVMMLGRKEAAVLFLVSVALLLVTIGLSGAIPQLLANMPLGTPGANLLLFLVSGWMAFFVLLLAERRLLRAERRRQEEASLRASAEQQSRNVQEDLAALASNMPTAAVFFNAAGEFRYANPALLVLLPDFASRPASERNLQAFCNTLIRPMLADEISQLPLGGVIRRSTSYGSADMQIQYFSITATKLDVTGAEASGFLVLVSDDTENEVADRKTRAAELRFRTLVESLPVGVMIHRDGVLTFANEAAVSIGGHASEESVLGLRLSSLVAPEHVEDVNARIKSAQRLGATQPFKQRRIVRPDGHEVFVEASQTPMPSLGTGEVLVLMVDVTERLRSEQARHAAEERMRATLETTPNLAVQWYTPQGRIVYWNAGSTQLWGYSADFAIGRLPRDVFATVEEEQALLSTFDEISATGRAVGPIEFAIRRQNGEIRHCLSTLFSIPGEGDEPYFVCMDVDISELKSAREELDRLNRELEQKVTTRTAALQVANADLEAFTSSVSHDLRTPIRHVLTLVDYLRHSVAQGNAAESQKYLDFLDHAGQRMEEIVDGLLSFARLGREAINWSRFPVHALVGDVLAELARQDSRSANVHWALDLRHDACADIGLLRLVFNNLLANAVKFSAKVPEPAVSVVSRERENMPGWIEVTIRDNGVGFDPRNADRLFGLFSRLHMARDFDGVGVGLAMSKRIIEQHGGVIEAEGRPGEGATFRFTLPTQRPHG
jgi:PAS domain S-box-containing protein